jgi:hypothetical protein
MVAARMMPAENFCYTKAGLKPDFGAAGRAGFVSMANDSAIIAGLGILACAVHH